MLGYHAAVKLNHLKVKGSLPSEGTNHKPKSVGAAQTPHVVTVGGGLR